MEYYILYEIVVYAISDESRTVLLSDGLDSPSSEHYLKISTTKILEDFFLLC